MQKGTNMIKSYDNTNRHIFKFDGGDLLTSMGATWFVVYKYSKTINPSEFRWRCATQDSRISAYNRSSAYHKDFLKHVLEMSDSNLSKAKIDITPTETKQMAKELLSRL